MVRENKEFRSALQRAMEFHRGGNRVAAAALYANLMKSHPRNPDLLHFYGLYCFQDGKTDKGIKHVKQCLDINPDYPDALNNLGNMFKLQGHLDDADRMYRRVIELNPGFYDAMVNLGILARARQNHKDAEHWYRQAIATNPERPLAYDNLTRLLMKLGRAREAVELMSVSTTNALREDKQNEEMHSLRARLMLILQDKESAVTIYKEWLAAFPDSKHAQHMLAAATGQNIPTKSDPDYVRDLFNRFSESFDEVLDKLDYVAPELVGQAVARLYTGHEPTLDVLDAGCGTGLCGEHLRLYSKHLTGVDISPGMLQRARSTALYDDLVESDLVAYLELHPKQQDLVVSSDTLNYFGDLQELFDAAGKALRSGGHMIFTLEMHEEVSTDDYYLNLHGRYSHSREYIASVMQHSGLTVVGMKDVVLRKENGRPVNGVLVSVQR